MWQINPSSVVCRRVHDDMLRASTAKVAAAQAPVVLRASWRFQGWGWVTTGEEHLATGREQERRDAMRWERELTYLASRDERSAA